MPLKASTTSELKNDASNQEAAGSSLTWNRKFYFSFYSCPSNPLPPFLPVENFDEYDQTYENLTTAWMCTVNSIHQIQ